jgi:hypothetical protein
MRTVGACLGGEDARANVLNVTATVDDHILRLLLERKAVRFPEMLRSGGFCER